MSEEARALFRLFRDDSDTPVELSLPPPAFSFDFRYNGRYFRYVGATPVTDYPPGYNFVCGFDYSEFRVTDLHPVEDSPARCIVCDAPFPLHTIRCGTAA